MIPISFIKAQMAGAIARGVRQCVLVGSHPISREALPSLAESLELFTVPDHPPPAALTAPFASGDLATALEKSPFDKKQASLFIWLGDAGYRTVEAVLGGLAFIASLPAGSAIVLDYAVERTSLRTATQTALDALASCIDSAGSIKYLIQPQAVSAMLRGFGFRQIADVAQEELPYRSGRLVSAVLQLPA